MEPDKKEISFTKVIQDEASLIFFCFTFATTFILMGMVIYESVDKNYPVSNGILCLYTIFLTGYITLKELVDRWIKDREWKQKPGELIVVLWGITAISLFIAEYFTHGKISPPQHTITNILELVIAAFLISAGSKQLHNKVKKKIGQAKNNNNKK